MNSTVARVRQIVLIGVATCGLSAHAGDFSGSWSRSVQLCDREHACTVHELADQDVHPDVCSSDMQIVQVGSRLCGTWDSGCSFGQGASGVLTGQAEGRSATIDVGESTAFDQSRRFPRQQSTRERWRIRQGKLQRQVATRTASSDASDLYDRVSSNDADLEDEQDFLKQCRAGVDFATP